MPSISEAFTVALNHHRQGHPELAEPIYRAILRTAPGVAELHSNLGDALRQMGRLEESIASCQQAIALKPEFAEARFNQAMALSVLGRYDEAVLSFKSAIEFKPDFVDAYVNWGYALKSLSQMSAAVTVFEHAVRCAPDDAELHIHLGVAQSDDGRLEDAELSYREAIRLRPEYSDAYYNLACLCGRLGRFTEAADVCRRALDIDPTNGKAHYLLSGFQDQAESGDDIERILSVVKNSQTSSEDLIHAHFSLGRLYDQAEMFDNAFRHYQTANALADPGYDIHKTQDLFSRIIDVFSADFLTEAVTDGHPSDRPVFIVGMPRSGTTLVEQIISSHSDVFGAGELQIVSEVATKIAEHASVPVGYPAAIQHIAATDKINIADMYLQYVSRLSDEAKYVTDKMPENFMHLGLIAALFPQARVIHCRRHPLDVCLSCYFQNFTHVRYSFDLETIGAYYREYERLMQHWREVLPIDLFEVDYEELVDNQETLSRQLIEYCGLSWEEACLEFYNNDRPVKTASIWQVRQPIYQKSIERWKNYEDHLEPLLRVLDWSES